MTIVRTLALLLVSIGASACRREDPTVIDRARFIDTYVELRTTALASRNRTVTPADRDRVLQKHGVTSEDLLHFADVKGADPDYMVRLWTEIAGQVPLGAPPPSTGLDSLGASPRP